MATSAHTVMTFEFPPPARTLPAGVITNAPENGLGIAWDLMSHSQPVGTTYFILRRMFASCRVVPPSLSLYGPIYYEPRPKRVSMEAGMSTRMDRFSSDRRSVLAADEAA